MTQEDWDAKEFIKSMIGGDCDIPEMLADLSHDQLAAIELVLQERLSTGPHETRPFQERMRRETVQ